jgi:2'-5' RNA ligase
MAARRLFAGVKVEPTEALRALTAELPRVLRSERIRWVRLENLHLTVEFFGFVEEERIPELEPALAQAAAGAPAFPLRLTGAGTFGNPRQPRVLWLGVEAAGLHTLHGRVAAALREAGWTPEARPFAPHLTLGRLARLQDPRRFRDVLARLQARAADEQAVRELILFESAAGRYVPLRRWPLAG